MTDNVELDPKKLTFSQNRGYKPIPSPLALEEINRVALIKLWDLLAFSAWSRDMRDNWYWKSPNVWIEIFQWLHSEFLVQPLDEFTTDCDDLMSYYRDLILEEGGLEFNEIFDLFQMIMRHPNCPDNFISEVAELFKQCQLAYVVHTEQPVTILPAVTQQEGAALIGAISELRGAGLHGAEVHLRTAGELMNEGDWPGAVRESIHAVESVARQLDPNSSNTLRACL